MISMTSLFELTWRWGFFCWDNSPGSLSNHAFCGCGMVGTKLITTQRRTGLCGRNCCLARNVINNTLVDRDRILFPPLHIMLSLIKQFPKALDKDGGCFSYLGQAIPGLKAGIFNGPQIRQLIRDPNTENSERWGTGSVQQQGREQH